MIPFSNNWIWSLFLKFSSNSFRICYTCSDINCKIFSCSYIVCETLGNCCLFCIKHTYLKSEINKTWKLDIGLCADGLPSPKKLTGWFMNGKSIQQKKLVHLLFFISVLTEWIMHTSGKFATYWRNFFFITLIILPWLLLLFQNWNQCSIYWNYVQVFVEMTKLIVCQNIWLK
jgi:hypothetical protein